MGGSIGIHRPQTLGASEVPVHIFPPVIQDSSVRHEVSMPLEKRTLSNLVNIGAVLLHSVEIPHDMPVAHAVFGLAR